MRTAHQGVPVAALPNAQGSGLFPTIAQMAQQVSAPSAPPAQAAIQSSGGASRPAQVPARGGAVRPEAAAGLDGWLVDRLFGR